MRTSHFNLAKCESHPMKARTNNAAGFDTTYSFIISILNSDIFGVFFCQISPH